MLHDGVQFEVLKIKARPRCLNLSHVAEHLVHERICRLVAVREVDEEAENGERGVV